MAGTPGKRHRKHRLFRDLYEQSGHCDPLMFLGELISRHPSEIAEKYGISQDDALAILTLQVQAARTLAPYLHSQMPREMRIEGGHQMPLLVIGDVRPGSPAQQALEAEGVQVLDVPVEPARGAPPGLPAADAGGADAGDGGAGEGAGAGTVARQGGGGAAAVEAGAAGGGGSEGADAGGHTRVRAGARGGSPPKDHPGGGG